MTQSAIHNPKSTMGERTLFDEKTFAVPARADSPPQVEAAEKVAPHAGRQARRILESLKMCGPMMREEIARLTGIPTTSVCARLREMECPDRRRHAFLAGSAAGGKGGTQTGTLRRPRVPVRRYESREKNMNHNGTPGQCLALINQLDKHQRPQKPSATVGHTPELSEALKNLLDELSKSASDIESHDYATRVCVRNRLNSAASDLHDAITEIGRKNQSENFDWIGNGFAAGIRRMALAPKILEVLKKARRLRSLECTILTNRKLDALQRNELRREANRIEDEISDIIAEAEGPALSEVEGDKS